MYRYLISYVLEGYNPMFNNTVLDLTRRIKTFQDKCELEKRLSIFDVEYPDGVFGNYNATIIGLTLLHAE